MEFSPRKYLGQNFHFHARKSISFSCMEFSFTYMEISFSCMEISFACMKISFSSMEFSYYDFLCMKLLVQALSAKQKQNNTDEF